MNESLLTKAIYKFFFRYSCRSKLITTEEFNYLSTVVGFVRNSIRIGKCSGMPTVNQTKSDNGAWEQGQKQLDLGKGRGMR